MNQTSLAIAKRFVATIGAALALLGASLPPSLGYAQAVQDNETQLYIDGIEYACLFDPSSWHTPTPEHDALVEQGYATSIWIAGHAGFAPFSDRYYLLCRPTVVTPVEPEPA